MTDWTDSGSGRIEVIVDDTADRVRLDAYLADRIPELSRSRVVSLLESGRIRLNGRLPRKSEVPTAGDLIEVDLPDPEPVGLVPEPIPLEIIYQDADLAVVEKPSGLVVHPAPGHRTGTLVHALLYHLSDLSGIGGELRPGIVHRLDRETSGLLLIAKHDESHRRLSAALKRREIVRRYLVSGWGHLREDEVEVDAPIGRSPTQRQRMAVVEGGRSARTFFRRLERWVGADLLEAELESGRTHQIRVHLSSIGHPVVGDTLYGGGAGRGMSGVIRGWAREFERRVPRHFLHAAVLGFEHPRSGEWLEFRSELPDDLAAAAEWARETSGG